MGKLATCEISSVLLVSIAQQAGLSLTCSQIPKDRVSRDMAYLQCLHSQSIDLILVDDIDHNIYQ